MIQNHHDGSSNSSNLSIPTASLNANHSNNLILNSSTSSTTSSSSSCSASSSLSSSWNSNSSNGGGILNGTSMILDNSSNSLKKKQSSSGLLNDGSKDRRKKKKREKRKKQSSNIVANTFDPNNSNNNTSLNIHISTEDERGQQQILLLSPQQESQRGSNLLVEYSPTLVGVQTHPKPPSPNHFNNNNITNNNSNSGNNTPSPSTFYRGIHHPLCSCSTLQQQHKLPLQQIQHQQIIEEEFEEDDDLDDDYYEDDELDVDGSSHGVGGDIDEEMAEDEMEPNRYAVGDQMDIDPIDPWYSGDPLVSEVLKDERETISNVEMRTNELATVERTIKQLNETKQAIERDIRLHRQQLRTVQRKKHEYIKTIANSYISIAIRYNLAKNESRCLTLILPDEVMLHIFCFLTPMDLCSGVCRVSRKWRSLAFDISLWRDICLQRRLLDGSSFFDTPPPKPLSLSGGGSSSSSNNNNNNNQYPYNSPIKKPMECDEKASSSSMTTSFDQQSPQISYGGSFWGDNWYVGEFRKDSNWRRGKYRTTVLRGHKEIVWSLLYEPETNSLISGSEDMTVKVWDCNGIGENQQFSDDPEDSKKRCMRTLSGHKNGTICLGSTLDRLISGSADGSVKIWNRFDGTCIDTIQTHSSVWCLQIVDSTLICGCVDGTMRVFDLNTTNCLRTMRGHTAPVRCLQAINHNGQDLVVSGSYDKTIRIWDMDARCTNTIRAHTHKINCLQYENGQLVSGSHDSQLKVWDMSGQLIHTLQGHDNMIHCLQFKGNKLLSGSTDSTIRLWDLKNGTHVNTIKGQSAVCCLKFTDSKLITGYEDSTIKIFDFSY